MISAEIDMRKLTSDLVSVAAIFGEANETGIARWGVATDRRLIKETQAWGDGKEARLKQEGAFRKDADRVAIILKNPKLVDRVKRKSLTGLLYKGEKWKFRPHQNITTAQGLNDWMELNRFGNIKRPPKKGLKNGVRCVTTDNVFNNALKIRNKRAGKAKGGWIGAGQAIGAYQKKGSRITIGKNVAGYAHKWKSGGTASMKRDIWTPEGTMENKYKHAAKVHVIRPSQMQKAIIDGAKNTITWYERTLQGRLNKRNK